MADDKNPPFDPPYRTVRLTVPAKQFTSVEQSTSTAASLSTMSLVFGTSFIQPTVPVDDPLRKTTFEIAADDHPIYNLVGRVASAWARIEHELDTIIWELAGIEHQKTACITGQMMGATPRYRAIYSLLKQKDSDAFNKLADKTNGLLQRTYDPYEKRNRIIHDPWYVTKAKAPAQFRAMPFKDPRFGIIEIDDTDIQGNLTTAKDILIRVEELRKNIKDALEASRQKSG